MRYIAADRRGPYLWVTFSRPDKLNVLHAEDLPGLRDTVENPGPDVTGLVFTGAGPAAFSAGMNIETFVGMDRAGAKAFIGQLAGIMQAIRRAPVVTVAAVSGYCLGGAFELALACDLRVVTTTAAFGLPEIKVGVPSVIDAALLPGPSAQSTEGQQTLPVSCGQRLMPGTWAHMGRGWSAAGPGRGL